MGRAGHQCVGHNHTCHNYTGAFEIGRHAGEDVVPAPGLVATLHILARGRPRKVRRLVADLDQHSRLASRSECAMSAAASRAAERGFCRRGRHGSIRGFRRRSEQVKLPQPHTKVGVVEQQPLVLEELVQRVHAVGKLGLYTHTRMYVRKCRHKSAVGSASTQAYSYRLTSHLVIRSACQHSKNCTSQIYLDDASDHVYA